MSTGALANADVDDALASGVRRAGAGVDEPTLGCAEGCPGVVSPSDNGTATATPADFNRSRRVRSGMTYFLSHSRNDQEFSLTESVAAEGSSGRATDGMSTRPRHPEAPICACTSIPRRRSGGGGGVLKGGGGFLVGFWGCAGGWGLGFFFWGRWGRLAGFVRCCSARLSFCRLFPWFCYSLGCRVRTLLYARYSRSATASDDRRPPARETGMRPVRGREATARKPAAVVGSRARTRSACSPDAQTPNDLTPTDATTGAV